MVSKSYCRSVMRIFVACKGATLKAEMDADN